MIGNERENPSRVVDLKPGKTRLETEFTGGAYDRGAFFVYIRRRT